MISDNPFAQFQFACEALLKDAINRLYPDFQLPSILLQVPPNLEFGELAASVCFELAKYAKNNPRTIAEELIQSIDANRFSLVESVQAAGAGYINFHVNSELFSRLTLESIRTLGVNYGYVKTSNPQKILLEHTSVNPVHPIHVGQARNPVLGDALARILKEHGHNVSRHYYVDDVGRQSAVIAYGYLKLGKPKTKDKPDRFIGGIYAVTSCIMEVERLKKAVKSAKTSDDDFLKLQKDLDEWVSISMEMEKRFPELFSKLYEAISNDSDPEQEVSELIQGYEAGDNDAKQLLREVCVLCLKGFKETLARLEIQIDSWDWESDLIWNGNVDQVIEDLKKTPYVFEENGVLEFDAEKVAHDLNLKSSLGISKDHELSSLTLVRADGTSLYTTRDIAYHL